MFSWNIHVLKSWDYIKPKRGEETPQERKLSKREVEEIRNDLIKWSKHYITYEMEDKLDDIKLAWDKYEGTVIETHVDNEGCVEIKK